MFIFFPFNDSLKLFDCSWLDSSKSLMEQVNYELLYCLSVVMKQDIYILLISHRSVRHTKVIMKAFMKQASERLLTMVIWR